MKKEVELTGVKEIARRANVSIGTVDRVIHNRKGVSDKTKKKIEAIIAELNFQPNKMASLLASKKNVRLGVLIPSVTEDTDYWIYPLNGIKQAGEEIGQFGVNIEYFFYDLNDKGSFVKAGEKVFAAALDGLLMAPSFVEEASVLAARIHQHKIPLVFINSDLPKQESLTYVGPDLFQSGRLAAQMVHMATGGGKDTLIINMATELDHDHHLLRKENGFRNYFEEHTLNGKVITLHVKEIKIAAIEQALLNELKRNPEIGAVFVTNSRANLIAGILEKLGQKKVLLIGYDFLKENLNGLQNGNIDILICQRPTEQGYLGINALYKHLFKIADVEAPMYMPIDIITKENYRFYNV